jgi:hypothetical protein
MVTQKNDFYFCKNTNKKGFDTFLSWIASVIELVEDLP